MNELRVTAEGIKHPPPRWITTTCARCDGKLDVQEGQPVIAFAALHPVQTVYVSGVQVLCESCARKAISGV